MPYGLERFYGGGDLHFITASCYRRRPLLGSAWRRDLFVEVLEQVRQRYQFVVVGYVVMPEHFHLLVSEPQKENPSVVIQALKLGVARRIVAAQKRRKQRNEGDVRCTNSWYPCLENRETWGTLEINSNSGDVGEPGTRIWQVRFYDYNVWTARKWVEKLRYIHRNPVRRRLVASPEQWRWSSFRAYACGEVGPVRVNDWTVLKLRLRKEAS